jgi:hypothetical protein
MSLIEAVRIILRHVHDSIRTEEAYIHWIRSFIRFHDKRHPHTLPTTRDPPQHFFCNAQKPWRPVVYRSSPIPDITPSPCSRAFTRFATTHRLIISPIRRSIVNPSSFRTRDHPIPPRRSPLRLFDLVLLLAGQGVSDTRSGVLAPQNGDADVNMVDFCDKIAKSARNLPERW